MATGGKLEVQIGADITDFEKKIKEVEYDIKELSKVKLEKIRLGLDTKEINAQIKDAKNNLNGLKTAVRDTGGAVAGMAPKVANGSNALMQFSRIAQDAPYGIIGIGNNITATVEAFGHLKNSTGTAGGALKAMASSLMGTGGILLGVSLLTTGLTLMAQSGLSVGDVMDKVTGKFDAFAAALKKANEEAIKNSADEISGLNALIATAKDVNLSMKDRLIAVNELQKTYPGYFGNLSKEEILNKDIKTAIDSVTQALIAKAKAQAYTGEIVKLAEEEFKLEEKRSDLLKEQSNLQKGLGEAIKNATNGAGQAVGGLRMALESVNSELINNKNQLDKNAIAQDKWTKRINENVKASIGLKAEMAKPIKAVKTKQTFDTPQVSGLVSEIIPEGIVLPPVNSDAFLESIKNIVPQVKLGFSEIEFALYHFNTAASEIINGGIMDTFAGIGTAIGQAMATGGNLLNALGASLLSSLGGVLTQMGKMAIEIGVGLLAVKFALKSLNPYAAIAAGVGLIALGSMFSAKSSSIGGSMGGGGNTSTSTGQGANNSSTTSGGGYGWSGGGNNTVVFEIAGTSLIGVLNNTTERNLRIGGRS